jgi:hypothetical protein
MATRLLTIDGGGIRGIYAAHVLQRIESEYKILFHRDFDLIAGTSTGSIIAAALALRIPLSDVLNLYQTVGPKIFRSRLWSFDGLLAPKYSSRPLRRALENVFQDYRLKDTKTRLLIPATDIGNGCVHVFKSAYDPGFIRDPEVKIVDAVIASCSAPVYFAPVRVDSYQLCDGGLWANNPALVAVTEAMTRLGKDRSEILLLSIGTGIGKNYYSLKGAHRLWGFITGWGPKKFISMLLNLQSATANNVTKLLLDPGKTMAINFESDMPLAFDDTSQIDDMVSRADRDFTHASDSIRAWFEMGKREVKAHG